MAYVTPGTVAAGDVATAAAWNVVVGDIIQIGGMAQGVFTNEVARDAAITSPVEGMHAYLTAGTAAVATGDTYAPTPTGVQTIYNGSKWVCVTPISASTDTQGTIVPGALSASLTSGGTNPSVRLETGTSALITVSAQISNVTATNRGDIGVQVSGATTKAAVTLASINCPFSDTSQYTSIGRTYVITLLTAGINTFALNYTGNTGTTFSQRSITVQGIA